MKNKWEFLRYFSRHEAWGNPELIDPYLLLTLDVIRHCLGWPFIVHCGVQGKHVDNSYHYFGQAVDGHFITETSLLMQSIETEAIITKIGLDHRLGLGLYPLWNFPGFHLDTRGKKARWGKITESEYCSWEETQNFLQKKW